MNYWKIFLIVFFGTVASGAPAVFADTLPVVTSFTASASSIAHSYGITFTWMASTDNFSGVNFYFTCPVGVTIKNVSGSDFSCNSSGTAGSAVTYAGAAFYVKNVSGSTQTVSVKIVPKDYGGTENTTGAMQTSFMVTPLAQPITGFTAAVAPIPLNTNVALSWTGFDIPGANLQFDCVSGIRVTSMSPAVTGDLPCGTLAYASDLAASGSVILNFANDSAQVVRLPVRVFPAIATRVYDGTRTLSLTLDVVGKAAAPVPMVSSFTASAERIVSGDSATLSWVTTGTAIAAGGNLQVQCWEGIAISGVDSPATTTRATLPCGRLMFGSARTASGSTELFFTNTSGVQKYVSVFFFPQNSDGTYDATKGKEIALTVLLPVILAPSAATSTPSVVANTVSASAISTIAAPASSGIARTFTFTTPLYFGMRGSVGAVTELQKFLAQDPALYPEGLATGYFGKLTELAVRRFQKRYGLAQEGDPAFGFVGPKTRAKLNGF